MSVWPMGLPGHSVVVLRYAGDCVACSALSRRCMVASLGRFSRHAPYPQHSLRSTATVTHSVLRGDVRIGILYGIPGVKLYHGILCSIYFIITHIYIIHTSLLPSLTTCLQPVQYVQCWVTLDDNTALEISVVWSIHNEEYCKCSNNYLNF
jgi:hypothetical protein